MEDVLIFGLLRGALLAMVAFGFTLVLGVVGIVNFAHGAFVVFGALLTHYLVVELGFAYYAALPIASAATGLLAVVVQRGFIARAFHLHPFMVLVQTFGIAIIITELGIQFWGSEERLLRIDLPFPPIIEIGDKFIPTMDVIVFVLALLSAGVLSLLLSRTEFGRAVQACRDNPSSARLSGINIDQTYERVMMISGIWAGLAGGLFMTISPQAPYMDFYWTIDAFLVVIIGGLGSMIGALVGGFFYGVLHFAAVYYFPTLSPALIFTALIALLIVRPQGFFGAAEAIRK
ncbi:MAG: branched-chain amino acid ABC transporter permease [Roseovarius sp.]